MKAKKYYHIKLSHEHLQEAANISTGVFSPLKGFLTKTETKSVLDKKHLPGGMPWTIPIVLDIPQWIYQDIKRHKHITLIDGKDRIIAVMTVKDIYRYDKEEFAKRLKAMGLKVERLDGDIVRQSLTKDLGFSKEDRDRNIERVTFVAKLLSRNAVATLVSFVSPYREKRRKARQETTDFVEAYLKCPVEECQKRERPLQVK